MQKDIEKQLLCKEKGNNIFFHLLTFSGISLIEIPHWWDRQLESLSATIHSHRPDLFSQPIPSPPIPLSPPIRNNPTSK
jgi:hypothetical protein